jgi:hypothetical protein
MARKPKATSNEELLTDDVKLDVEPVDEPTEEEAEDVEETQELSFGDESYSRLGEIPEFDEWN